MGKTEGDTIEGQGGTRSGRIVSIVVSPGDLLFSLVTLFNLRPMTRRYVSIQVNYLVTPPRTRSVTLSTTSTETSRVCIGRLPPPVIILLVIPRCLREIVEVHVSPEVIVSPCFRTWKTPTSPPSVLPRFKSLLYVSSTRKLLVQSASRLFTNDSRKTHGPWEYPRPYVVPSFVRDGSTSTIRSPHRPSLRRVFILIFYLIHSRKISPNLTTPLLSCHIPPVLSTSPQIVKTPPPVHSEFLFHCKLVLEWYSLPYSSRVHTNGPPSLGLYPSSVPFLGTAMLHDRTNFSSFQSH